MLQFSRFFIPQVEEAISRMMSMKSQFDTILANSALISHFERFATTTAKFISNKTVTVFCLFHFSLFLSFRCLFSLSKGSYLHWVHVKCMHPPLEREYWNLHFGHSIPLSFKCFFTPAACLSGSLDSFQLLNCSQVRSSCCFSHCNVQIKFSHARLHLFDSALLTVYYCLLVVMVLSNKWIRLSSICTKNIKIGFGTYRLPTLGASHRSTIWTSQFLLPGVCYKARWALKKE